MGQDLFWTATNSPIASELNSLQSTLESALSPPKSTAAPTISLLDFVRLAWEFVEPSRPLVEHFALKALCDHLEALSFGRIDHLIANVPPGMAKSTVVAVLWPCWEWTFRPWLRWLFVTYARKLTYRDARRRREIILSDWYQEHWGHIVQVTEKGVEFLKTSQQGHMFSTSTDAQTTGWRAHRSVLDDPQDPKGAESDVQRESTNEFLTRTLPSRVDWIPGISGRVLIQQRLHEMDATGLYLKGKSWTHLKIPLEYAGEPNETEIGYRDPRTKTGEVISEELYPTKHRLELKRTLGPYGTAGQLQQEPAPPEGGIIKRAWMQTYRLESGLLVTDKNGEKAPALRLDPFGNFRFITADLAFRKEDFENQTDPDYTVFTVWMVYRTNRGPLLFALDMDRARFDESDEDESGKSKYESMYLALVRKWKIRLTGIDSRGFGSKIVRDLKRKGYAIRELGKTEDALVYIDEKIHARVMGSVAFLADARLYVPDFAPWLSEFVKEATSFPNAAHDDTLETLCSAIAIAENYTPAPAETPSTKKLERRADQDAPEDPLRGHVSDGMNFDDYLSRGKL